jgi:hypothetical protein
VAESGRVQVVYTANVGSPLTADVAAGATVLFIDDTSDFDTDGTLHVGGQTVAYSAVDDDTGQVTLTAPVAAAADAGDLVTLWDTGLDQAAVEYRAHVELPGLLDNADAVDATIRHTLIAYLEEGIRTPGTGESVRMERQGSDWVVVDVLGKQPAVASTVGGGGAAERVTCTATTGSLAAGATDSGTSITVATDYTLYTIATSRPARVRLYQTAAARTADLSRPVGTDPASTAGVTLEFVTAGGGVTYPLSPLVDGASLETTPSSDIPMTVTNNDSVTGAVTVTVVAQLAGSGSGGGATGPAGPTGATGPAGPTGATGATGPAGPLQDRGTTTVTTSSLAAGATDSTITCPLATTYRLLSIQTSRPARVRLYNTAAKRTADLSRPVGTDPVSDTGVMLEFITVDTAVHALSPLTDGASMETVPGSSIPMSVTNNDTVTGTVAVTFTWQRIE